MKTLLRILLVSFLLFSTAFAYTPTSSDARLIETTWAKVEHLLVWKSEAYKSRVMSQLEGLRTKYASNERVLYILDAVIGRLSVNQTSGTGTWYSVVRVTDGDTIQVNVDGKVETIRILGIDTPEKYTTRTGYKECYWDEASNYATKLLAEKKVRIESDETQDKTDKYGRMLAHVFLEDGTYYEGLAIRDGFGFRYVYDVPTKYDAVLKRAEETAKQNNVWVWAKCDGKREPLKTDSDVAPVKTDSVPSNTIKITTPQTNPADTVIASPVIPSVWSFSCSVIKTKCAQMNSCEEAKFYLNSCGISRLDWDKDGVPCESICR